MSRRLTPAIVASRTRLERTASPFETLSSWWLGSVVAPIGLTLLVITAGYVISGGTDPDFPPQFPTLVYGIASVVVVGVVCAVIDQHQWHAAALFRRPGRAELVAGVGATVLGVLVGWPLTTVITDTIGVARYALPSIRTTAGLIALGFGAVVVAPVVEEVLYRGLFVGIGLSRGYSPLIVGTSSLLVFAVVHVFTAGVAGIVNAFLLGTLLTWLRLRFDNLVGAWLFHALNNLLELVVALSLVPSLYAL
jgi:membrane protease YdiL (CAAX protease family)